MRYDVALIDGEETQIDEFCKLFRSFSRSLKGVTFSINTFSSGDELIRGGKFDYDIVFLDAVMAGTDGFSTAKIIRRHNKNAVIVFATAHPEYAINGYEVRALDYLIKPITKIVFDNVIAEALTVLKNDVSATVAIENSDGIYLVNVSDILYIEINLHYLYFNVLSEDGKIDTYRIIGSLKQQKERLKKHNFGQCMACYLVNFRHVRSIEKREVRLNGNVKLPISRKFHKTFSEEFLEFVK